MTESQKSYQFENLSNISEMKEIDQDIETDSDIIEQNLQLEQQSQQNQLNKNLEQLFLKNNNNVQYDKLITFKNKNFPSILITQIEDKVNQNSSLFRYRKVQEKQINSEILYPKLKINKIQNQENESNNQQFVFDIQTDRSIELDESIQITLKNKLKSQSLEMNSPKKYTNLQNRKKHNTTILSYSNFSPQKSQLLNQHQQLPLVLEKQKKCEDMQKQRIQQEKYKLKLEKTCAQIFHRKYPEMIKHWKFYEFNYWMMKLSEFILMGPLFFFLIVKRGKKNILERQCLTNIFQYQINEIFGTKNAVYVRNFYNFLILKVDKLKQKCVQFNPKAFNVLQQTVQRKSTFEDSKELSKRGKLPLIYYLISLLLTCSFMILGFNFSIFIVYFIYVMNYEDEVYYHYQFRSVLLCFIQNLFIMIYYCGIGMQAIAGNQHNIVSTQDQIDKLLDRLQIRKSTFHLEFAVKPGDPHIRNQLRSDKSDVHKSLKCQDKKWTSGCKLYLNYLNNNYQFSQSKFSDINLRYYDNYIKRMRHFYNKSYYSYSFHQILFKIYTQIIVLIRILRIFSCTLIWYAILQLDEDISWTEFLTNFAIICSLLQLEKVEIINKSISKTRIRRLNALKRLTNMIQLSKENIKNIYHIPKEVPTINLYCHISLQSWYDCRRITMKYCKQEIDVADVTYTIQFFKACLYIVVLILDYLGIFWSKHLVLEDYALFAMIIIQIYLVTFNIIAPAMKEGADGNQHFDIHLQKLRQHLLFLKKIRSNYQMARSQLEINEFIFKCKQSDDLSGFRGDLYNEYAISEIYKNSKVFKMNFEQYNDQLIKTTLNIIEFLETDKEQFQDAFLGIIPMTYSFLQYLLIVLIPVLLQMTWEQVTQQEDNNIYKKRRDIEISRQ